MSTEPTLRVNFGVVDNAMTTMEKMKQYITAGMDTAIDVVSDFTDYGINDFAGQDKTLGKTMEEYTHMELDMQQFIEAVQQVKQQVQTDGCDESTDLLSELEARVKDIKKRDADIDLHDHQKYRQLTEKIRQAKGGESSQDLDSSLQGDIAISQATVNTKCPFTGKEMTDPVKNVYCGHRYDREGIKQLLNQRKGRAKCPVAGCANTKPITDKDLTEDKEVKKQIAKEKRGKKGK